MVRGERINALKYRVKYWYQSSLNICSLRVIKLIHLILWTSYFIAPITSKTFSRLWVDKSVICNQLQISVPSRHFPTGTPKQKGRWKVSKSFDFACVNFNLYDLHFLKPNSTSYPTNYDLNVMHGWNATWICSSSQMSALNHKLTLNDPLEAVTNFCEPEQWLLNKDSKPLEINNPGCLGKLLVL